MPDVNSFGFAQCFTVPVPYRDSGGGEWLCEMIYLVLENQPHQNSCLSEFSVCFWVFWNGNLPCTLCKQIWKSQSI